MSKWHNLLMNT